MFCIKTFTIFVYMRRLLYVFLLLKITVAFSQCPDPGEIFLRSQEDVDAFTTNFSDCKVIDGNLIIISSLINATDDGEILTPITNLSNLNFLEEVKGDLIVSVEEDILDNFQQLKKVAGKLEITACKSLIEINSFQNLETSNSILIALNANLLKVSGFNNLETINESLEIGRLENLKEVIGFDNLKTIGGQLNVSLNNNLEQLPSFNNVVEINNDLNFTSNPKLKLFDGLKKLELIGNDLNVEKIETIRGFDNLKNINRFFNIIGLEVKEIPSFNNLKSIGASFTINNTSVTSIVGFDLLENVGNIFILEDRFQLSNNLELQQTIGFLSLSLVDGNFVVINNPKMLDCSWMCNLLNNGKITGQANVANNGGDCSDINLIIEKCDPDFDDDGVANVIDDDDDNDGILDALEGGGNLDSDKDGFPDSKDLDSDNDGCFDVVEAGFLDGDNNGTLGNIPDTVDIRGIIIGETTGYTNPLDTNSNSIFDFQEDTLPNPGKNNIVEICFNYPKIDLFNQLLGTPDRGGYWSPALSSGTGEFDPQNDTEGIYTYIHNDPLCGERSAKVQVTFPSKLRAGKNREVFTCVEGGNINLFSLLEGNPTPGGVWVPQMSSETSIFNPNIDPPGVYSYVVSDDLCGDVQANITVSVSEKPNTGKNKKIVLCEFANPFILFDVLEGNPNPGGVWTLNDNPVSVFFDPSTSKSGVYKYTIDNGNCGFSSTELDIEVIKNEAIDNVTITINDFSATNNNIIINTNNPSRVYEYSLDGISYQRENKFNNLKGGYHTVYLKGVDGCQFYEETIFIKSYPIFFSPNSDGVNDTWQIDNFPDEDYQIYIYNRFGKQIKYLKNKNEFWDGTESGKLLASNNYWFKLVRQNGQILFGNFSLLRK